MPAYTPFHSGGSQDALARAPQILRSGRLTRVRSETSSEDRSPGFAPGHRREGRGRFGRGTHDGVGSGAGRSFGGAVLHASVRTILPSGPLVAIASFGSAEGHSLAVGSLGRGPWTRSNMDAHLRTHCAPAALGDSLFVRLPNREVAYALRSDSMARRSRSGLYSSSSFHIRNTVAARMRASVSLARLGFVPPASIFS